MVRVELPALMLRLGYNEIALRSTAGSWLMFDALRLEAPAEFRLAPAVSTVTLSIRATNRPCTRPGRSTGPDNPG